jgi:hypothetical protein
MEEKKTKTKSKERNKGRRKEGEEWIKVK